MHGCRCSVSAWPRGLCLFLAVLLFAKLLMKDSYRVLHVLFAVITPPGTHTVR